jgi:lipoprotein-releasing system ATP-binding protein
MLSLHQITKSFGTLRVLKGIDLQIAPSEIVSIVGPSGAGKTTLLQIMGTLDAPTSGTVFINGTDTTTLSPRQLSLFRNRNLGFIFQFHQLLPEFSALENIMIPGLISLESKGSPHKNTHQLKERAMDLLKNLQLADRANHKPNELSGGEKQRIAVARALINNPAVILADEPSGSLDTQNRTELHQLFFDLRQQYGHTFVIVTHDETLSHQADRTIHLIDGQIQSEPEDLTTAI